MEKNKRKVRIRTRKGEVRKRTKQWKRIGEFEDEVGDGDR